MVVMMEVASSSIARIGYDEAQLELYVEFKRGDTYVYAPVPPHVHLELMGSASKGNFVNLQVKPRYGVRRA